MVDAFSAVMGPEHRGRLRLYGVDATNARNDAKMEKQMKEHRKTVRQEVIADVISQLKHGLVDPNILAALSIPSPREATSVQGVEQVMETVAPNRGNRSIATRSVVAVALTVALDLWL
ncbi:hypothetical protein H5410_064251 [Solanum commersonii]|uniref:Uncharacterized protein n=1 Tax=Solanum commersonii TaxID=4109 RepID=A0A9J5VZY1_SOLCO|nr:hypothetical protein H5410_064251 [Solanum commersonii]